MPDDIKIPIGKLLRANLGSFVAGCRVHELQTPALGALVKVKLHDGSEIYGLISNITIQDDGLVRQIASRSLLPAEYEADNRFNRNLPVEIDVLTLGYRQQDRLYRHLPPRPPFSLDALWLCDAQELCEFTENLSYLRHILRVQNQPLEELLVSHFSQARAIHQAQGQTGWYLKACQALISQLRDDYEQLAKVLSALGELEAE
ncbi:MAG: hypothetical protein VB108_02540 [Anaerolineaceae bacterium]|nr:hypothetical protein [Anaerolineaceae bacterium]